MSLGATSARPEALRDLPPFPPVAAQLLRLLAEEEPTFRKLGDVVRADAAFAAQVLRLANSSLFGVRQRILTVPHAIAILGLTRLRAAVLTLAMKEFLMSAKGHEAVRMCWRHNLATALATELICEAVFFDHALGYTAGLLHDIGKLVLATSNPEKYWELLSSNGCEPGELRRRERELFSVDHAEAGRLVFENWGLPHEFQQVAERHHEAARPDDLEVTDLVRKGCWTADSAGFSTHGGQAEWNPRLPLAWIPDNRRARYQSAFADLPLLIAEKINSFDCEFLT